MFKGDRNLAVGLFISTALIGLLVFAIWLAGTTGNAETRRYSILFERDVSGLAVGGQVYYLGVAVGSVTKLTLIPGNPIRVRVDITVLADTPVDSGSYASLMAQGITGVTVINISGEPGEHSPLPTPEGSDYPLIPVRETGLSALLSQAPTTMAKINLALDQLNELLGEDNRQQVAATLQHAEQLLAALAAERGDLARLPQELTSLVVDMRATVTEVSALLGSLGPGLDQTLEGVHTVSANLAQLTQRLDALLADNRTGIEHFIDNGLGQAPELIFDLRGTLRELQKLLHQLQEDPSQLIHRPPNDALEVKP